MKAFQLKPPMPPRTLLARPGEEIPLAIRIAMKAALAGDFALLDKLELEYVNLLVRIGELQIRHADGRPHSWCQPYLMSRTGRDTERSAPFVTAIRRAFGPRAETALEWQWREKCRRCAGLLRHVDCRVCEGRWWVDDMQDHELVYTDVDGVLLEPAP